MAILLPYINFVQNNQQKKKYFKYSIGKKAKKTKGSKIEFLLSADDVPKEWGAFIKSNSDGWLTIEVTTPPKCPVGKWQMKIDVVKKKNPKDKPTKYRYEHKDPIYILFNPWCKGIVNGYICTILTQRDREINWFSFV